MFHQSCFSSSCTCIVFRGFQKKKAEEHLQTCHAGRNATFSEERTAKHSKWHQQNNRSVHFNAVISVRQDFNRNSEKTERLICALPSLATSERGSEPAIVQPMVHFPTFPAISWISSLTGLNTRGSWNEYARYIPVVRPVLEKPLKSVNEKSL